VRQAMVNPNTGEAVPSEQIRRGFAVDKDTYVMVDDEELKALVPAESRTIQIEQFVPNAAINHQWYERAYYLGPDESNDAYAALVAALGDNQLEGVARWVMRKRSYVGSLQVSHGHLLMVSLRYADEVIAASSLPRPEGRALDRKEVAMAEQLVAALHTEFDPNQYHDEHRQRVLDFIDEKAKGKKPRLRLVKGPKETKDESLLAALTASMKAVKSPQKRRASA